MRSHHCILAVLTAASTSVLHADFIEPDGYGWERGDDRSFFAEWDVFTSPLGQNRPDVGTFPGDLPTDWVTPDVIESTGASFITGSGNIYSFSLPTDFDVVVPNYGLDEKFARTTLLVQIRTLGSELEYESVRIGEAEPVSIIELERITLGGGIGGTQVDTLFEFDLSGNESSYQIEFNAAAASMSLDRLAVDTFITTDAFSTLELRTPRDAAGPIPSPASSALVIAGLWGATRRRQR